MRIITIEAPEWQKHKKTVVIELTESARVYNIMDIVWIN